VVHLVILACVLRATTKKCRQVFLGKKCTPGENPSYTYESAHPWKKSRGRPCELVRQLVAFKVPLDKANRFIWDVLLSFIR